MTRVCCITLLLGITALLGCAGHTHRYPILITQPTEVADHVGKVVLLRGVVTNSKIPTINGVEVDAPKYPEPDRVVEVMGRLDRYRIESSSDELPVATRPPGVYYRLVDTSTGKLIEVN